MDYLNRCILLGRYKSITIIDDNVSYLVIVINDKDSDLTIIIVGSGVAKQLLSKCEDNCLIAIKSKIDADDPRLIIKVKKYLF